MGTTRTVLSTLTGLLTNALATELFSAAPRASRNGCESSITAVPTHWALEITIRARARC